MGGLNFLPEISVQAYQSLEVLKSNMAVLEPGGKLSGYQCVLSSSPVGSECIRFRTELSAVFHDIAPPDC